MSLLKRILGMEKKAEKPYIYAGIALIHKLTATLNLSDWKDLLPSYTEEEIEAINKRWSSFQRTANEVAGGDAKFHPEIVSNIQRMVASEALAELAGVTWKFSDELPKNWRQCVSTYLKAWAAHFNPIALLDLGDLLVRAEHRTEAKEVFKVVLLFPTYADTYYAGQQKPELVEGITNSAKESLRELASLG